MNWTQIILTAISTLGSIVTTIFASKAKGHAQQALFSADEAKAASLRPPGRPAPVDSIAPASRY